MKRKFIIFSSKYYLIKQWKQIYAYNNFKEEICTLKHVQVSTSFSARAFEKLRVSRNRLWHLSKISLSTSFFFLFLIVFQFLILPFPIVSFSTLSPFVSVLPLFFGSFSNLYHYTEEKNTSLVYSLQREIKKKRTKKIRKTLREPNSAAEAKMVGQ